MKRHFLLIVVILAGVALAWAAARWPQGGASRPPEQARRAAARYQCPMHPNIIQDRPGNCPICGMELVPVGPGEEGEGPAAGPRVVSSPEEARRICQVHNCRMANCPMHVHLKPGEKVNCPVCGQVVGGSAEAAGAPSSAGRAAVTVPLHRQQLIGVRTARVERRRLAREIRTVGKVAYDPVLYQTQAEYLQALAVLESERADGSEAAARRAEALVEAAETRLRLLGLGEEQIQQLRAAPTSADRSLLLTEGAHQAWVYAEVYEQDIDLVRPGMSVRLDVPTLPGKVFEGRVEAVDPVLHPASRSARARIAVTGEAARLKPETYVNVFFRAELGRSLAVPREAILETGMRRIVFVVEGEDRFEPRELVTGHRAGDWVEVKEGLRPGERVVTSGNFLIDSESQLRAAAQAMTFYGGQEAAEERGEPAAAHRH